MKRKFLVLFILALMIFQFSASAAPYKSYVYDSNGMLYNAPDAFYFDKSIDTAAFKDENGESIGRLSSPSDLYIDHNKKIYISDNDNNRIVVLNEDYTLNKIISSFTNNGQQESFSFPSGTFVDKDNSIYICDTNNRRVVHLDKDGKLVRIIDKVESPVLPKDFTFQPTKIVLDTAGRIFIISNQFNLGVIELDRNGQFLQCLGAPKVTYNIAELIWRSFSTKEQKDRISNFVPTEYNNISVDEDGFLFVTTDVFDRYNFGSTDFVRKLSAKGKDVLRKPSGGARPFGDDIGDWTGNFRGPSRINDVITLDNGVYGILDWLRCRVFFYNAEGINLFNLGTPPDNSDTGFKSFIEGTLEAPTSIGWINDSCLVLDNNQKVINVFKLTDYGKKIIKATELHYNDEYDAEAELWKEILVLNNNSSAAKQSLGKVAYRVDDYKTAMEYFKSTMDVDNYSKAFKLHRRDVISENFTSGAIILLVIIVALYILSKVRKKYMPPIKEHSYLGYLLYAKKVIFRPLNGYWGLQRENHSSVASATTIFVAAAVMSLLQARFTGFVFDPTAEFTNVFMEIFAIAAPLLLFCVCNWCVTSLLNGEGNFKAIYISSCYALTPIIILYPFAILLSNIMVKEEGDFYTVFLTIALLWVLMLIFAGNMRTHDFSLGKTVAELFITVLVMILVVFLSVLFFALVQQMNGFVKDIINEIATLS